MVPSSCDIESIITGSSSASSDAIFLARLLLEDRSAGVAVGVELGVISIEVEGDAGIP